MKYDLKERLIKFAVLIVKLVKAMSSDYTGKHFGGQLLRSGSSPALNYGEALGAESQADFIHKMSNCLKELRETEVNLEIIDLSNLTDSTLVETARKECDELVAIFVKSVSTARKNKDSRKR